MKTTFRYLLAAVVLSAAAACTKSEDVPAVRTYEYALDVIQEPCSRTSMDGSAVLWSQDDKIGVTGHDAKNTILTAFQAVGSVDGFVGFSIDDAENYVPSAQASFTLTLLEGVTPVAVAYPFFQGISYKEADDMTQCKVRVPDSQKGVKGNIPQNALAMVGAVEGNSAQLYTVGSVIRFEITRSDIASLEFKGNDGEYVSKESWYDINTGNLVGKTGTATTTVTLTPSEGDVFEPGEYYFVVAPVTLKKGFTITLTNAAGETAERSTSDSFTLVRNTKYTGFGSDQGWFADEEPEDMPITQKLVFSDGTTKQAWPFVQSIGKNTEVASLVGPFYTESNPSFVYSFVIASPSTNEKCWQHNKGRGLSFGGTIGDYMSIHAVEGYKVTTIKILSGGANTWKCTIYNSDNKLISNGAEVSFDAVENQVGTFENLGTEANQECRIYLTKSSYATINELWITYEPVQ